MIVDRNNCQIDGRTEDVMKLNPVGDKFRAFNFHTIECNGNNIAELRAAFAEAREVKGRPTCIVAETFMGRGVSFMEDDYRWHGKPPTPEQEEAALGELV
jgi:transketolase